MEILLLNPKQESMKYNLFILLAGLIVLSSCSSRMSLMKRRYTKGYFVSVSGKNDGQHVNGHTLKQKNHKNTIAASDIRPSSPAQQVAVKEEQIAKHSAVAKVKETSASRKTPATGATAVKRDKVLASVHPVATTDLQELADVQVLPPKGKAKGHAKGGDADVNLLLLVILAIIIPPLAVFLKKGAPDTWFWVTLILWLAAFSYFVFKLGSLFALVAIVIALLVVFDKM
jgi:uncharacterized membrane protein YqaE (UPF0057 family)